MWNVLLSQTTLRKEIEELKAERTRLKDTVGMLEASGYAQRQSETSVRLSLSKVEEKRDSLLIDVDELKKLVREQTGADLLVNALEAVGIIKPSLSEPVDYIAEATRLSALQQQTARPLGGLSGAATSPYARPFGSPYGLSGILGGWS